MINADYRHPQGCFACLKRVYNKGIKLLPLCMVGMLLAGSSVFQPHLVLRKGRVMHEPKPIDPAVHSGVTHLFQQVARSMHYENFNQLSVRPETGSSLKIEEDGFLTIDEDILTAFKGDGPYSRTELQGMFAHEVSHLALNHLSKKTKFKEELSRNGDQLLEQRLGPPSFTESEEIAFIRRNEEKRIARRFQAFERDTEMEADHYVAQFSDLGRGLHDALQHSVRQDPRGDIETSTHPSYSQRIESVTQVLCQRFPQENQDIC